MKGKLLILVFSLTFMLIFPGLASAQYGSISGMVTDVVTGLPIMGAHVRAMGDTCPGGGGCGDAVTDSNGFYIIQHLPPGPYLVIASAPGYQDEVYPDSIIVVAGQNMPNIDFALTPVGGGGTGSISGRVTDEMTGNPILHAHMIAIGLDNWCFGEAWTDSIGNYVIPQLCAGIWQVRAEAPGYVPEVYPETVLVIEDQNTPDIDFALTPMGGGTGSISGRVTDETTGIPLPMAHIWAYGGSCPPCGAEAWSDTAGYYLIQHLTAAQYVVKVHKDGYVDEVYPDSVTVVEGQNTPNIDFALTPMGEPGSISGTVIDSMTGEPIRCAHISAYGEFGHGQAHTDSLGHYTISGLYPGSYFVTAWAMHYYPQDYPDTVLVVESQNTSNIDFALVPYGGPGTGVISGTVMRDTVSEPDLIPFAIVFAISWGGHWGFDITDSTGSYTIEGLQTDDYYVFAVAPGYVGEFYDNVYTWEEATLVTPDAYGINFHLAPCGGGSGSISGMISSNDLLLEGAFVYAEVNGEVKGFARSSTDGGYIITGLETGVYTVTASMVMYHDGFYPDPIWVVSGKASGVNINLPPVVVGDVTGEGSVDLGDVVFLINYLYKSDLAPNPLMTGDLNCDGALNLGDVVYLISYLYKSGSPPCNP
jgi:protocatechuate 3,4-dioxygenase beta subunit